MHLKMPAEPKGAVGQTWEVAVRVLGTTGSARSVTRAETFGPSRRLTAERDRAGLAVLYLRGGNLNRVQLVPRQVERWL